MKIFNGFGYYQKVNFVDDNNVFVGYDMAQFCCEDAGWFIADEPILQYMESLNPYNNIELKYKDLSNADISDFYFDTNYFKEVRSKYDDENLIIFKITNNNEDRYIHIYNSHNGWYSHGFVFQQDNKIIKEGQI